MYNWLRADSSLLTLHSSLLILHFSSSTLSVASTCSTRSQIVNFDELMSLRIIMNYELQNPPLGFAES